MPNDYQNMFNLLRSQYSQPAGGQVNSGPYGYIDQGFDQEEELRRRRRQALMQNMLGQQDNGMVSDIFSAIGGGVGPGGGILGGIVPNVLAAIFKKRQ